MYKLQSTDKKTTRPPAAAHADGYLGDGVFIVHEFIRTTHYHDVINSTRQVSVTCVLNIEVQRPQHTRLAAVTRCTQATIISKARLNQQEVVVVIFPQC